MLFGLLAILVLVLTLPFLIKIVERNLEIFLFLTGLAATIVAGVLSGKLVEEILTNRLLYMITGAVLAAGILFKFFQHRVKGAIDFILKHMPLRAFLFLLIVGLGLASSLITAIIASLLLVEIVNVLPLGRRDKINLTITACFSIGLGAALTPVGEPLSTIVVSKLHRDFLYLLREVGRYIFPGILAMGLFGAYYPKHKRASAGRAKGMEAEWFFSEEPGRDETYLGVLVRALKIFAFIIALELLGAGFKPVIDAYVVHWDSRLLYWVNMISAVLDNATLAAAEISAKMSSQQIQAILMGLLISGGMLIPGNIPNIVSAGKLRITSRDWARLGVPLGLVVMAIFFVVIFVL